MVNDNYTTWVDTLNVAQANWAYEYLRKRKPGLVRGLLDGSPNRSVEEKLWQVLRDFPQEEAELVSRMRKAFSQKKLREKKSAKCAVNYFIPRSAKNALDRVSKKTGLNKGEVLSRLLAHPHLEELVTNRSEGELRATPEKTGSPRLFDFNRKFPSRGPTEPGCAELDAVLSGIQDELARLHEKVDAGFASRQAEDPDEA